MNALTTLRESALSRRRGYQDENEEKTLLGQAVHTALTPLRIATSRPAIKAYLTTLLFFFTSFVLISLSTTAYLLFYYNYIPQIGLTQTIYLQYETNAHPHATVAIDTSALITQQPYDIFVSLHMPRTPSNMAAGNFMLDLSLRSESLASAGPLAYLLNATTESGATAPLARSRRPAILPYNSVVTSLSHKLLHLPVHLLSLKDLDASELKVPMFERLAFTRGRKNLPSTAYLEIQSQTPPTGCPPTSQPIVGLQLFNAPSPPSPSAMQIYSAQLHFHARFEGLRFYVYNYRIISFLLFTSLFYTLALMSMAAAWAFITAVLSVRNPKSTLPNPRLIKSEDSASSSDLKGKIKTENPDQRRLEGIKPEEEDDSDLDPQTLAGGLSSTERTFPTLGPNARPLRYTPSSTTDGAESSIVAASRLEDATHDAEDEDEDEEDEARGRIITPASGTMADVKDEDEEDDEKFHGDSGLGTSMESEARSSAAGLVRRRSGRGSRRGSGSRG